MRCARRRLTRRLGTWPFLWRGLETHERSSGDALAFPEDLVCEYLEAQPEC